MTYPVSVVIPSMPSRRDFLVGRCLPSVFANDPSEVIVLVGDENGNVKRNLGATATTAPYLLFVDDDSVLRPDCIKKMLAEFDRDPGAAFVYANFERFILPGVSYPGPPGVKVCGPFYLDTLRLGNYIDTKSLLRREKFPGFDPSIRRFQDWDLWLTIAKNGGRGRWINETLFELWQIDEGISVEVPEGESLSVIREKHAL